MDLIERYLQAVRFWLPKDSKQDITAELSEDIHSQVDAQESAVGRKLREEEVADILKQLGRPVFVANRYQPQRSLVGPMLFPIYLFVLKVLLLCYFVPWILIWIVLRLAGSPAHPIAASVTVAFSSLLSSAAMCVGIVTLIFALLERRQGEWNAGAWDPRKLPALRHHNRVPRSSSIAELVVNTLFSVWWVRLAMSGGVVFPGIDVALTPAGKIFCVGAALTFGANIAVAAAHIRWPYWTRTRAAIRLVADLSGSVLFCWVCRAGMLAGMSVRGFGAAQNLWLTQTINTWVQHAFWGGVAVACITLGFDLHRLIGTTPVGPQLNGTVRVAN